MKLLIVIVVLFLHFISQAQSAKEIVQHYLDTVSNGNVNNWRAVKTVYKESLVSYTQQDLEQKIDLTTPTKSSFSKWYSNSDSRKNELYDDSIHLKLTSSFYYLRNKTVIKLDNVPPMFKPPIVRDEFHSEHFPVHISKLLNKCNDAQVLGIKKFPADGLECFEVRLTVLGRHYYLFINTSTYLLNFWNGREDQDLSFLEKYDEYKNVDGFLVPILVSYSRNGAIYFSEKTTKIRFNAPINPIVFNYK